MTRTPDQPQNLAALKSRWHHWCVPLILLMSVGTTMFAAGDPAGAKNLAGQKILPEGPGLAATFKGDNQIASHPEVIFADNFESGDFAKSWDDMRNKNGKVLKLVDQFKIEPLSIDPVARTDVTDGPATPRHALIPELH